MKNYYMGKFLFSAALMASCFQISAQNKKEVQQIRSKYNLNKLQSMEQKFSKKVSKEKEAANLIAKQKGWKTEITTKDGRFLELQKVVNGKPIYYTTFNVDAAKSTRTNHLNNGGSLGLNLMGQSMTAHVWDGGIARATHQEYDGAGGNNRYSVGDGHTTLNFHAAHVTGTIMAAGIDANAKGMAPHAKAVGHFWDNDQSEATSAAANGMLISNHSYGFAARNPNTGQVQLPQHFFGGYIDESRGWDEIMFNAPNYLMVVAAGNDGNDNTANNNPTGGSGFDKLTGHSTSKNNLVVANAQDANVNSNGNLVSVSINSSSSEGPTDDFRIKPDITGNGTGVYSSYHNSNTAYNSITGTSMASPNVAGSLLLLQQHHNNEKGSFMRSATLKGLALHTADDAGASGPDAVFGWGLLNAKAAAETITKEGNETKIEELTLTAGQTYTITVDSDGTNPLLASISWTDRPGVANTTVNSTTPVLVNDLDIRVSKGGTEFLPYELTGATTNAKRDNNVDPYERIDINGASGTYTITVTHKGTLTGGSQNYSLIVTGLTGTPVVCNATTPTGVSVSGVSVSEATVSWNAVTAATYDVRYRVVGSSSWTTNAVASTTSTLSGLTASTQYQVQVRSKCSSGNSSYSSSTNFTTTAAPVFCSSGISSFPYSEGFESNAGWTQAGGDDGDWVRRSGSTPSNTTGPSSADEGSSYLFLEASSNSSAGQIGSNATAILESGCFDLSGQSAATFAFKNHMYGTDIGSLTLQATTNGSTWTNVWTESGNKGNQWNSISVDLASYVGSSVKLRFVGVTGNGWRSDIAIDDLSISATAAGSDTQAPSAPSNVQASSIAQTTATISWSASTDNVAVTGYDVYQGATSIGTVTNTSANVTGLTANTSYTFSIRAKDAAGNESSAGSVTFTTESDTTTPVNYCASSGNRSSFEWIDNVELGGMTNSSGNDGGYEDYTANVATLSRGSSNTMIVSAGFSGQAYTEFWAVWIDFNQNGTFEASEQVVNGSSSSADNLSSTVDVPSGATLGQTRMRVSMKYNAAQTACENFADGEVEDYTVNITASTTSANFYTTFSNSNPLGNEDAFKVATYPNPATNFVQIQLANRSEGLNSYKIVNTIGQTVQEGSLTSQRVDISKLNIGMYILEVNDGQKAFTTKLVKR